jgi:formiminotetrahydrofolate cyclodeaminase
MMKKTENNPKPQTDDKNEETKIRRDFLKKFGKYAVSVPVVTFTLMSANTSKAITSGGDDGAPF